MPRACHRREFGNEKYMHCNAQDYIIQLIIVVANL
jgi:hypothetical protein